MVYNFDKIYFTHNVLFEAHRPSINRLPFTLLLLSYFKYSVFYTPILIC